jgi:formate dehydrogenase beta subunit
VPVLHVKWHATAEETLPVRPTDVADPDYFHKVVDCQWACPAHTPVPEYIRLIAQGQYDQAYMVNWMSNVFPGVLGRTCDRPCEPACRRGRVEDENLAKPEPVAICRLKRVAADYKGGEVRAMMPRPQPRNGKRVACVGGGPASLTVARDLATQGYAVTVFDGDPQAGGFMRTQVPRFRLPEAVIDEEVGYILQQGVEFKGNHRIASMKALLAEPWDAVFVGSGAPRGRDLHIPGRHEAAAGSIHIGIDWLASVSFGHITSVKPAGDRAGRRQHRDGLLPLGPPPGRRPTCKVVVRSGFEEMKASPWEKEDAEHEGIPILNFHVPKDIQHNERPTGRHDLSRSCAGLRRKGRRTLVPTGEPDVVLDCDDGADRRGPGKRLPLDRGRQRHRFDKWGLPVLDEKTLQSSVPQVFFGGDAAFGPKNIITAVAHGHEAAVSIDRFLHGEDVAAPAAARPT